MKPVRIRHPEIEGTALTSEHAFLRVYQGKGWQLDGDQPPTPADTDTEPKRPQRNDSTDAWRSYAIARGMNPDQAKTMPRDGDDGLIAYIDTLDHTLES